MPSKLITLVFFAAVVFLTGYWLHRSGSPYGTAALTMHKLLALAAIGLAGTIVFTAYKGFGMQGNDLFLWACTIILLLIVIATGGMISAMESIPNWLIYVHRLLPYLATSVAAISVYQAISRTSG